MDTLDKLHSPLCSQQMKYHLLYMLMIIDFSHSFKDYNEILNFYGIWEYACPGCNAGHSLHRHAKYERNLIVYESQGLVEKQLEILRLQCGSCHSTHAILTSDMISFFIFSIEAFLYLIAMCLAPESSVLKAEQKTGISYQLLYRFLQIFHEYRDKLILFLRRQELWVRAEHPLSRQLLKLLYFEPPPWLDILFFKQFRVPLFIHRRTTVSYPLLFGCSPLQMQSPT